jgi:dATP pyrophosphohydrolase
MVSGGINKGETASQTALREIYEETGLRPTRFYSGNIVEIYYDAERDTILTNPVFVAFIDNLQQVRLSPTEHDAFKWVSIEDAVKILEFDQQQDCFLKVYEKFIKNYPMDFLKIDICTKNQNYL